MLAITKKWIEIVVKRLVLKSSYCTNYLELKHEFDFFGMYTRLHSRFYGHMLHLVKKYIKCFDVYKFRISRCRMQLWKLSISTSYRMTTNLRILYGRAFKG